MTLMQMGVVGEALPIKLVCFSIQRRCSKLDKACLVQIIEQIMEHVADVSGADPVEVRRLNFLKTYPLVPAPQIHPGQANGRQQVQIPVPFVISAPAPPSKSVFNQTQ